MRKKWSSLLAYQQSAAYEEKVSSKSSFRIGEVPLSSVFGVWAQDLCMLLGSDACNLLSSNILLLPKSPFATITTHVMCNKDNTHNISLYPVLNMCRDLSEVSQPVSG